MGEERWGEVGMGEKRWGEVGMGEERWKDEVVGRDGDKWGEIHVLSPRLNN